MQNACPSQFEQYCVLLKSDRVINQLSGLIGIQKVVSRQDDLYIQPIIEKELLPALNRLLECEECPQIQVEAA